MFKVKIFTLYPEFFPGPFGKGIYGNAIDKKIWDLKIVNIREFAEDKHKTVDDTPYGGGSGTDIATINKLLKQFKMMSEMMKKMSKGNMKGMEDKGIPPELFNQLK